MDNPLIGLRVEVSNYYLGNTACMPGYVVYPIYPVPGTISALEMKSNQMATCIKLDNPYSGNGYASGKDIANVWLSNLRFI